MGRTALLLAARLEAGSSLRFAARLRHAQCLGTAICPEIRGAKRGCYAEPGVRVRGSQAMLDGKW